MQRVVGVLVLVTVIVFGAASAKTANPAPLSSGPVTTAGAIWSWGRGVEAALPVNAAENGGAFIESVSCPSAGNCSAVGTYADRSGKEEGLLLTETAGRWTPGVEAVLPANATAYYSAGTPGAFVRSVSCASAGNCSAIGTYFDSSGNQEGLLLTETAGSWSAGVEAVLPANAASSHQFVQWGSVSCASAGNCAAAGLYTTVGGLLASRGLVLTETDGRWSAGVEAVTPVPDSSAWLSSVSCTSAGNCTAVGAYEDGSGVGQGLLVTETAGSWAPGTEAVLPADSANLGAELTSVSCASAGNCSAVGQYDIAIVDFSKFGQEFRGKGLLLTETAGRWATGVGAALPANADGPNAVDETYPLTVSCASARNCSAAGSYYDNNSGLQGVLLTETAGSWAAGVEARVEALPANAGSGGVPGPGFINAVSCASPGDCGALVMGGNLLTQARGSWATGVKPPLPANAAPGSGALLYAVSCGSPGNCTAVGSYSEGGLLTGGSPALVRVDVSKNGPGSGVVSSNPTGIDCRSTCSAPFEVGTVVTLTATPSAGSRFSGWSGGVCFGPGTCRPNTGIAEQAVTATFSLLPKCVVPELHGKTLRAAEHAIRSHACTVSKITDTASPTIERGRVISQRPRPGRRLPHGARVSLVVSNGRR